LPAQVSTPNPAPVLKEINPVGKLEWRSGSL
jgi:hypothetical protein